MSAAVFFVVAVRRVEAAYQSLLFRIIADSPDLRHPVTGYVEIRPQSTAATTLTVSLKAHLEDEGVRYHLGLRER
jgi:hypothetical protein